VGGDTYPKEVFEKRKEIFFHGCGFCGSVGGVGGGGKKSMFWLDDEAAAIKRKEVVWLHGRERKEKEGMEKAEG